ncbi:hypothetical protein DVH05_025608 [Phytophthora capsici]|nr:hypothetical protein DVH05_025608 [Phytophthora capsici]
MASSDTTDGDVEMPLAQPTYEYIRAPRLTEWSQPALVARQRRRYEEKIQVRCSATGEAAYAVAVSIKASMESRVLDHPAFYILKKSVLEVTDDDLVRAIKVKAGNIKNDYVPDLDKLFDQLKMNMQQSDIEARVVQYFIEFDRIVEEHGLVGVLDRQGTSNPVHAKMRFRLLLRRLQPEALRHEVESLAQVTHRHVKTALYELIVDRAKRQHQAHLLNLKLKATRGPNTNDSKQETGRNNQTAMSASPGGSLRGAGQERSERSSNSRGSQPSRDNHGGTAHKNELPRDGCLSSIG